jgi:hypothetical protein
MKCFYHPQIDAVATCKNCNKGLCLECVSDVGNGVACKGKCESQVQGFNEMIQRGVRSKNVLGGYYKMWGIFFCLAGLAALTISFLALENFVSWQNIEKVVLIPAGLISLLIASYYLLLLRNHSGKKINF